MVKEKYSYGQGFIKAFKSERDGKRVYLDIKENYPSFLKREKVFTYRKVKDLPKRKQSKMAEHIGLEHGQMFVNEVQVDRGQVTFSDRAKDWLDAKDLTRQAQQVMQKTFNKPEKSLKKAKDLSKSKQDHISIKELESLANKIAFNNAQNNPDLSTDPNTLKSNKEATYNLESNELNREEPDF